MSQLAAGWEADHRAPRHRAIGEDRFGAFPNHEFLDDPIESHDSLPSFPQRLVLPGLLLLSWLLFELTANATLSVLLACLKFGWEDFRTAHWLRISDPDVKRGAACGWFYLASGVWKTAIMPILVVMGLCAVWIMAAPHAPPHEALRAQMASAITVGLGAAAALVLIVIVAVGYALTTGMRVWVHHELHHSRRQEQWPPQCRGSYWQHDNRGRAILATALIFVTIGLPPLLLQTLLWLAQPPEVSAVLTVVFGTPILATLAYAVLRDRIFARLPAECWPES